MDKGEKIFERLETAQVEVFLAYWEELASRWPNKIFTPATKGVFSVVGMAEACHAIKKMAFAWEEYHAPKSSVKADEKGVTLSWQGRWTDGRWVEILISKARPFHSSDRARWNVTFKWDSGTGQESTYLRVRELFDEVEAAASA